MDPDFRRIVLRAGADPDVRRDVEQVYQAIQSQIDRRRPLCVMSGRCCRFEEFGHRLFVTTLELACFQHDLQVSAPDGWDASGCPFQQGKLCSVHAIRPMGCRLFFCDPTAESWQNALYEQFHDRLKRLHELLAVPYRYLEWRAALEAIGLTGQGCR